MECCRKQTQGRHYICCKKCVMSSQSFSSAMFHCEEVSLGALIPHLFLTLYTSFLHQMRNDDKFTTPSFIYCLCASGTEICNAKIGNATKRPNKVVRHACCVHMLYSGDNIVYICIRCLGFDILVPTIGEFLACHLKHERLKSA